MRGGRKRETERSALSGGAFGPDAATMRLNQAFGNMESEAEATRARACALCPVVTTEKPGQFFRRNASPSVCDEHDDLVVDSPYVNFNRSVWIGILESIREKIGEHLVDAQWVCVDLQDRTIDMQFKVAIQSECLLTLHDLAHERVEVQQAAFQGKTIALDLRD